MSVKRPKAATDAILTFFIAAITIGGLQSIARVASKMSYADLVNQVKADFRTTDYYQAGYLINQAVNELCPAQIWQLRQSAAGYTPF